MEKLFKLNLQFFGEGGASAGASAGTGEGGDSASGDTASAAAEQRLRDLGVPERLAKKRASKVASVMAPQSAAPQATEEVVTSPTEEPAPTDTEEVVEDTPKRPSFSELLKDPEYNKEMQEIVKSRLKASKGAEEALNKMTPAIEVMARKYGLDATNMDYEALAKAINDDDAYYEEKAIEMGVSIETAKRVDQMERNEERQRQQEAKDLESRRMREHFAKLDQQAEALRTVFPSLDLRAELQNPQFARMVAPGVGLSVEDAYYAVHRKEINAAAMQVTAQKTAEKISNAIAAGSRRPNEAGASGQAASVSTFDYRTASKEQREAFKKDLMAKLARGEKVYPGQ